MEEIQQEKRIERLEKKLASVLGRNYKIEDLDFMNGLHLDYEEQMELIATKKGDKEFNYPYLVQLSLEGEVWLNGVVQTEIIRKIINNSYLARQRSLRKNDPINTLLLIVLKNEKGLFTLTNEEKNSLINAAYLIESDPKYRQAKYLTEENFIVNDTRFYILLLPGFESRVKAASRNLFTSIGEFETFLVGLANYIYDNTGYREVTSFMIRKENLNKMDIMMHEQLIMRRNAKMLYPFTVFTKLYKMYLSELEIAKEQPQLSLQKKDILPIKA